MIADAATLAAADRRSVAIAREWRASDPYRSLEAAFADVDADDAEDVAEIAEALLRDASWIGPLLDPLISALAADPWFEPPLKVSRDPLRTGAILYENYVGTLSAVVLSADALAAMPAAKTMVASGRMAIVRYVRAGDARLRRWYAGPIGGELTTQTAALAREIAPLSLIENTVVRQDGREHAYMMERATSDVVTLTMTIRAGAAQYARKYRREDGALLKSAALDDTPARAAMLLALLRLSGRRDVAAAFDRATRDGAFYLRWQAMREWLALDATAASSRLAEMAAEDPNEEIRKAARATMLLVAERQAALCPA